MLSRGHITIPRSHERVATQQTVTVGHTTYTWSQVYLILSLSARGNAQTNLPRS